MNEPEAWPKVEMTELERKLLNAAKGDRIPGELALRMASALSAPNVAPTASIGHGGLLFSKTGLWGFLSLTLLAGAGAWYTTGSAPRADATARVAPASTAQAEARARTQVTPPAAAEPGVTDLALPIAQAQASAHVSTLMNAAPVAGNGPAPALRGGALLSPATAQRDGAEALRQEIGLLDRAREALQHGAPQRAWSLLDQHQRRFAHGTLVPEAEALRIETLVRLGASARAQRMSRQFLEAYPEHPLRERVSALGAWQPASHSAR